MFTTKPCLECKVEKPLDEFHKKKTGKHGKMNRCKACRKILSKEYRKKPSVRAAEAARLKQRYIDKKEEIDAYQRQWRSENIEKMRIYNAEWQRNRRKTDVNFRLAHLIRNRIGDEVRGKNRRTGSAELLGCTIEELKVHIKSLFTEGMTWDLFLSGAIHLDHIIPCCAFDLTKDEEQRKCFHWTNLQPLWKKDNLQKTGRDREMKKQRLGGNASEPGVTQ